MVGGVRPRRASGGLTPSFGFLLHCWSRGLTFFEGGERSLGPRAQAVPPLFPSRPAHHCLGPSSP